MSTLIQFSQDLQQSTDFDATIIAGHHAQLSQEKNRELLSVEAQRVWESVLTQLSPRHQGDGLTLHLPLESTGPEESTTLYPFAVLALPDQHSRHNSPAQPHRLTDLLIKHAPKRGKIELQLVLRAPEDMLATACAVARSFPLYNRKSSGSKKNSRELVLRFLCEGQEQQVPDLVKQAVGSVRTAARLVDMPTSELNTTTFIEEASHLARDIGVELEIIQGEELRDRGFGGLWNVGRAATHPPALVRLSHKPEQATETVVWVGKGIVYDTGGLSIKTKTGMPGMKSDMGGAAAMMSAFFAAVHSGYKQNLHCLLCLAENAVSSDSFRPDDILDMYSGRTVEVNNTDAEGRLVLADGVAYAAKHLSPDVIIDMATLTGAQMVSTGRRHAAVVCNDEAWETRATKAGRISGDLVHPLPYCPEFFRDEFKSKVADMKNSVKDRANAQSSCAGQFIAEHLGEYQGIWLHVDIAGPSTREGRGTGYGVALLLELLKLRSA